MSTLQVLVGPLTSEFIPAGTCVSQGIQVVRYISNQTQGYNYYLTAGPGTADCFPSSQFPSAGSYYSPGRCPSGYSAACTATGGNSVGNATETTVTCCPLMPYRFECNTRPVGSDWGVFADCTTSTSTLEVDLDVIGAVPTSKLAGSSRDASGNPILTHAVINGYGIEVRWQQTDEALIFGATTASTASSTASNPNPPAMTTQMESSSRLNREAIAGIVVGLVVGALILLGVVVMIVRSKRKRRMKTTNRGTFNDGGSHHGVYSYGCYSKAGTASRANVTEYGTCDTKSLGTSS
ncbi:hypothetical protein F5X98DRAFT_233306 [Xylaria grammica]|nr:hypothetical protein F5X98DRAFT_233306 [Xylaria grammica]